MTQQEVENRLLHVLDQARVAQDRVWSTVLDLRVSGATWVQIGTCLGVSPQAAQQRFAAAAAAELRGEPR